MKIINAGRYIQTENAPTKALIAQYCKSHGVDDIFGLIDQEGPFLAVAELKRVLPLLGSDPQRKRVLDLGCGSRESMDNKPKVDFQPWLCRGLYALNIPCIGIDCAPLDGEPFEHYQVQLLTPDALHFLPTHSIDVANASMLFSSPFLAEMLEKRQNGTELWPIVRPQLERIVKPDGVFMYWDQVELDGTIYD